MDVREITDGPMPRDERFMREALQEARAAADEGEVPIGAVVVCEDRVIARAHNQRERLQDPSAHAEFSAVLSAARALGRWRLPDCTVYVTLEPCPMCAGLMVNARIGRCVYGAPDPKAGALGSLFQVGTDGRLNHRLQVTAGVLADECSRVLSSFFARRRGARPAEDGAHEAARLHGAPARPLGTPPAARPPRFLLAIDSFKGSASSRQVEAWLAEGIRHASPTARVDCLPIADGGEGTLDAVASTPGARWRRLTVHDPWGARIEADYVLAGTSAVIEMARAAGISRSPRTDAAARRASTAGVGELVLDALSEHVDTIYVGLGGNATTDGGAGFLQALGARLLDDEGRDVAGGLTGLARIKAVDMAPARERLGDVRLVALSDVRNPLVGRRGAVRVFGPQKGLDASEADDGAMVRYARLLDAAARAHHPLPFKSLAGVPGAGAAGGLGAAVLALGGRLVSGIDAILDLVGFDDAARRADCVVTGEGMMDGQTAGGKAPWGVARRARRAGKPVLAVVGGRSDDLDEVYRAGVKAVLPILRRPMPLEQAVTPEETRANLRAVGETVARMLASG